MDHPTAQTTRSCVAELNVQCVIWVLHHEDILPFDGFEILEDVDRLVCIEYYLITDSIPFPVPKYLRTLFQ